MKQFSQFVSRLKVSWRFVASVLVPLVLMPLILIHDREIYEAGSDNSTNSSNSAGDNSSVIGEDEEGTLVVETKFRTAYVLILMAIYWGFEILPLPITSLLPLVLFPILAVQDSARVSQNYTKESNMIFLGGVIIALGLEYCNLHRRIAVGLMMFCGSSPVWLLFGTMMTSAFLSMWISSTTCVAMIVPIVVAVIDEINESPIELPTPTNAAIVRKASSIYTPTVPGSRKPSATMSIDEARMIATRQRRTSTMFENPALTGARNHRRGSNFRADHPSPLYLRSFNHLINPSDNTSQSSLKSKPRIRFSIAQSEVNSERPSISSQSIPSRVVGNNSLSPNVQFKRHLEISSTAEQIEDFDNLSTGTGSCDVNYADENEMQLTAEAILDERHARVKKMFLLGLAYAANIGGTAVITAASPNKIFKENIKPLKIDQDGKYLDIGFLTWFGFNFPPMVINILIAWIYLLVVYCGLPNLKIYLPFKRNQDNAPSSPETHLKLDKFKIYVEREYSQLGSVSFHEWAVGVVFLGVVALWVFRDPELFAGWDSITRDIVCGDSFACILGSVLMFVIPRNLKFLKSNDHEFEPLLDWKFVSSKLPWGYLLLLGAGFALADAVETSGLSAYLGERLNLLADWPKECILILVIVITSMITEVISSVACASTILPILVSVSKHLKLHPLYLTLPAAVTCSYTFMLPVASPANAIVFAAGNFSTMEMAKNGLFLNIVCVAVLFVSTITYGDLIFHFENYEYKEDYPD